MAHCFQAKSIRTFQEYFESRYGWEERRNATSPPPSKGSRQSKKDAELRKFCHYGKGGSTPLSVTFESGGTFFPRIFRSFWPFLYFERGGGRLNKLWFFVTRNFFFQLTGPLILPTRQGWYIYRKPQSKCPVKIKTIISFLLPFSFFLTFIISERKGERVM